MSTNAELRAQIAKCLHVAQSTRATHGRLCNELREIHEENPDQFEHEFFELMQMVLLVFKRDAAVERVIDFVYAFIGKHVEATGFDERMMEWLLKRCTAKDKAVRFRSCQLIAGLMSRQREDADINDDLFGEIQKKMLVRTDDRIVCVKVQAIMAMCRLQDPEDPHDVVTQRYIELLDIDNSADVRKAALNAIALTRATLDHILKRTSDISEDVRKTALTALTTRVACSSLTIAQRVTLLNNGLKDRDPKVRDLCINLIVDNWIKSRQKTLFQVLKYLHVEEEEETAELLIRAVIASGFVPELPDNSLLNDELVNDNNDAAMDEDDTNEFVCPVSMQVALYWRVRCDILTEDKEFVLLEDFLPSGAAICRGVVQAQKVPFVQRQLILIALLTDLKDEGGRRILSTLLRKSLATLNTDEVLVKPMTELLAKIHPSEDEYMQLILETMSDVKDVLEKYEQPEVQAIFEQQRLLLEENEAKLRKLALKGIRESDADAEIQDLVNETATLRANEESRGILEEQTWMRCLSLACTLLQNTARTTNDPRIGGLRPAILSAIKNRNELVRAEAVRSIGLFAVLDKTAAFVHIPLLVRALENDVDTIRVIAAKGLVDIILVHGCPSKELDRAKLKRREELDAQARSEELGTGEMVLIEDEDVYQARVNDLKLATAAKPIKTLKELLYDDEVSELRSIAVEGLAKLFFSDRIHSNLYALSRLIVLMFDQKTVLDAAVRQCLAVFLPAFAQRSAKHREQLADAACVALPQIGAMEDAIHGKAVSIAGAGQYLMMLLQDGGIVEEGKTEANCLHARIAVVAIKQLFAAPNIASRKEWCRLLMEVDWTGEIDQETMMLMKFITPRALLAVRDRTAKRAADKFKSFFDARVKADERAAQRLAQEARAIRAAELQDASTASTSDVENELEETELQFTEKQQEKIMEELNILRANRGVVDSMYMPSTARGRLLKTKTPARRRVQSKLALDMESEEEDEEMPVFYSSGPENDDGVGNPDDSPIIESKLGGRLNRPSRKAAKEAMASTKKIARKLMELDLNDSSCEEDVPNVKEKLMFESDEEEEEERDMMEDVAMEQEMEEEEVESVEEPIQKAKKRAKRPSFMDDSDDSDISEEPVLMDAKENHVNKKVTSKLGGRGLSKSRLGGFGERHVAPQETSMWEE